MKRLIVLFKFRLVGAIFEQSRIEFNWESKEKHLQLVLSQASGKETANFNAQSGHMSNREQLTIQILSKTKKLTFFISGLNNTWDQNKRPYSKPTSSTFGITSSSSLTLSPGSVTLQPQLICLLLHYFISVLVCYLPVLDGFNQLY